MSPAMCGVDIDVPEIVFVACRSHVCMSVVQIDPGCSRTVVLPIQVLVMSTPGANRSTTGP
jgi:hypothetical protein